MNTVEILKAARSVLSDERSWTQGSFARDVRGRPSPISAGVCFCSIGAIAKVVRTNLGRPVPHPVLEALGARSHCDIARFNDEATHAEVLEFFDRGIARAERLETDTASKAKAKEGAK